jgi:hypothetical protein
MKQFIKTFLHRGALFCGVGPVIAAIVYIFLYANGVVETVAVGTYIREIFTSTLMAFVAAGISAVYTVEKLAFPLAGLIQGSVLLLDYLSIYLINGWLKPSPTAIIIFVVIFVAGFSAIWLIIYKSVQTQIKRINKDIAES